LNLGVWPGGPIGGFVVADANGYEFVAGEDYEVDTTCGVVCFLSDGDVQNGQRVLITYHYVENPNVSMSIGPSSTNPKLVHPVIYAVKDDDRSQPCPRGVEYEFWKVLSESAFELDLSSLNFNSGFEFNWPILCSETKLNHGKVTTFNRHYVAYESLNWATLTDFNNAQPCEEES